MPLIHSYIQKLYILYKNEILNDNQVYIASFYLKIELI